MPDTCLAALLQADADAGAGGKAKPAKRQKQDGAGKKASGKVRPAATDKENGGALNVLSAATAREQKRQTAADRAALAQQAAAAPKSRLESRPLAALTDK